MKIVDARRLRGPSLGASGPGAIVELSLSRSEDPKRVAKKLRLMLYYFSAFLRRLPMSEGAKVRFYRGGMALFVPAPIDALESALQLAEASVHAANASLAGTSFFAQRYRAVESELRRAFRRERDRRLRSLEATARRRSAPFLFDDDVVILGQGVHAVTYPRSALPATSAVRWRDRESIPVALITGTNGKTTTTRLVARMAKLAGLVPGNTSSDGVAIDEVIVEQGDNTGGESARRVLRDPKVEIAILETARGGLLRRGLAASEVDAALITNVTADHLGEHGVLDLATLVETKAVVGHAVRKRGKLVLGADDAELVRIAKSFRAQRVWFAASRKNAQRSIDAAETTFTIEDHAIVRIERHARTVLAALADVPLAAGGAAPHNVKNVLAAAALAWSLGIADVAVIAALKTFGASDNPGRGQVIEAPSGARVVLDFGHNPAAATDLYAYAHSLAPNGKVHAVLTQPGDRTDAAMIAFVKAVAKAGVASAAVWETESLLRGRPEGEIAKLLVTALRAAKVKSTIAKDEAHAIRIALGHAKKGDVVVVSPSLDRRLPV